MPVLRRSHRWPPPVVILLFSFIFIVSYAKSDEVEILLKFKSAVESSDPNFFSSWEQGNSACDFAGVVCNSNGFVAEINLPQQRILGFVPFDSICELQSLERIDLGNNSFHENVSEDLNKCSSLQYLDLGVNSFSGKVPDLSSLTGLKFLNLNNSGFSGIFPWKSLQNLTELTFLSLGDNPFDASPFPPEVLKFEKLYWLYLTNCSLTGQIPEGIQNLTLLQNLELSDNKLSGPIPAGIAKLNKLWQLELYNNSLSGKLPVGLGNISNLTNFDASMNMLEGDLSELRSLKNLASLQLFENQFSGKVPVEFGEFKHLVGLSLYRNKLTGQLPPKIGSSSDLNFIDVSENFLTGPIPPYIGKAKSLEFLRLANNQFSGELATSISQASSLVLIFFISHSHASEKGQMENSNSTTLVEVVDVSMNNLVGEIPASICNSSFLDVLSYMGNNLVGTIPECFGNLSSSLSHIDLQHNHFHGNLNQLQVLVLRSNRFYGQVNSSNIAVSFPRLHAIDLSHNNFSGYLPTKLFENLDAMKGGYGKQVEAEYMKDELANGVVYYVHGLSFTIKGFEIEFPSLLTTWMVIDFSSNQFSGEIPQTLGELHSLIVLNLSHNCLKGSIPSSFGDLSELESLALSSNKLHGRIPVELSNLGFLEVLNLSHNNLSGRIPQGKQFDTFTNDSYTGNLGLFGLPLSTSSDKDEGIPAKFYRENDDADNELNWKFSILMGYGCGLVLGLSMGYIVFTTGKPRWFITLFDTFQHR
ncbi:proline iminopeptidase [Hibiscus syriacus]|uniref:Proline iminopeptidase n=1 Tax=Hibiscus syriacus TaxID=106335 RepID=A0A6A3CD35_HIBSY|nr:proline iminopeptidase [Hibiscus syriacus]